MNILNFDPSSMTLAPQATTIEFAEKLLACKTVPHQRDWAILVTLQEVALMEFSRSNGLIEKASISHEEIEEEVHQMVVTFSSRPESGNASYLNIVILHDQFMLMKLVLNMSTLKFHRTVYTFSLFQQLPYFE